MERTLPQAADTTIVTIDDPGFHGIKMTTQVRGVQLTKEATVQVYDAPEISIQPILPASSFSWIPGGSNVTVNAEQLSPADRCIWRVYELTDRQENENASEQVPDRSIVGTGTRLQHKFSAGNHLLVASIKRGRAEASAEELITVHHWKPPIRWWVPLAAATACGFAASHFDHQADDYWVKHEVAGESKYYDKYSTAIDRENVSRAGMYVTGGLAIYFALHEIFGGNDNIDREAEEYNRSRIGLKADDMGVGLAVSFH